MQHASTVVVAAAGAHDDEAPEDGAPPAATGAAAPITLREFVAALNAEDVEEVCEGAS